MKKIIFSAFVALSLVAASTGWSQNSITISGDTTVPCHGMVKLSLTGASANVAWLVMPEPVSEQSCDQQFFFSGPPGTYTVISLAVAGNQPVIVKTICTIQPLPGPLPPTPGPTPPTPGPGPGPTPPTPEPTPPPAPVGTVWAIAIYDTAKQVTLPSGQLAIFGSPTISVAAKKNGAVWRRFDVGDNVPAKGGGTVPINVTSWGAAALKVGLPALVIIDSTNRIVSAQPLPPDEVGVIEAIRKVTGGGS